MPRCDAPPGDCPAYLATRPWWFAIEAPIGSLGWMPENARFIR
jgi:hypothetical protein